MNTRKGKAWRAKYKKLQAAVIELYVAAVWHPDVPVENETELWAKVRDAAGLTTGMKTALFGMDTEDER